MREKVNDLRSQESSEPRERRPTAVARSSNRGRNRTELAGRHQSHRPRQSLGITPGVPPCRSSSAGRSLKRNQTQVRVWKR